MVAMMYFVVTDEIEFRLCWIRIQDGTFRFRFNFFDCFFKWLLLTEYNISIKEWTSPGRWQGIQLTIHISAEQVENNLEMNWNVVC